MLCRWSMLPAGARVEESVVDYAMLVEEPAESPTEAAIEVVAEGPQLKLRREPAVDYANPCGI